MKVVLVVEDNLELRENTAEILELSGYYVLLSDNSRTGYDLAKSHHPDVIIFDIMMQPVEVIGFVKSLREDPDTRHIPFLLLDGNIIPLSVRQTLARIDAVHLSKPFTREELLEAVQKCLDRQSPLA